MTDTVPSPQTEVQIRALWDVCVQAEFNSKTSGSKKEEDEFHFLLQISRGITSKREESAC